MAKDPHQSNCYHCGRCFEDPDRAHDGSGGHVICPFCGHYLPTTYRRSNRRIVRMPSTRVVPTDG